MLRIHHVNLGVTPDAIEDEVAWLTHVLGLSRLESPERFPNARWFTDEHGVEVHLSEDPDHRPAARAHVAIELGDALPAVEARLPEHDGIAEGFGGRVVFAHDPAGNRWELRGA